MKKTNIIFLDIDGVLNSELFYRVTPFYTWDLFNPRSVLLLNELIEIHNVKIIITSNWCKTYGMPIIKKIFKKNGVGGKIIDAIPSDVDKETGIKNKIEILSDLKNINYVILDDEELNIKHLVQTNPEYGLTLREHKRVDIILNK